MNDINAMFDEWQQSQACLCELDEKILRFSIEKGFGFFMFNTKPDRELATELNHGFQCKLLEKITESKNKGEIIDNFKNFHFIHMKGFLFESYREQGKNRIFIPLEEYTNLPNYSKWLTQQEQEEFQEILLEVREVQTRLLTKFICDPPKELNISEVDRQLFEKYCEGIKGKELQEFFMKISDCSDKCSVKAINSKIYRLKQKFKRWYLGQYGTLGKLDSNI